MNVVDEERLGGYMELTALVSSRSVVVEEFSRSQFSSFWSQ